MSYPTIERDNRIELASVKYNVDSGNPYRDPNTGKFSFGIPGVQFYVGLDLFKNLPKATKDATTQRILASGANIVGIKQTDQGIQVIALKDGRFLDKFTIKLDKPVIEGKEARDTEPAEQSYDELDISQRDAIIEVARDLDLVGAQLQKEIEKRFGIAIDNDAMAKLEERVEELRVEDLINYLHDQMRERLDREMGNNLVRIKAPRGYLRKVFSRLSEDQAREVLERLRAKGWSESEVQDQVVESMPKRLKDHILEKHKVDETEDSEIE